MDSSFFTSFSQATASSDPFLLGIGVVLVVVWGEMGLVALGKAQIPSVKAFWTSHPPRIRYLSLLLIGLLIAYGGNTSKQPSRSRSSAPPARTLSEAQRLAGYALTDVRTNTFASFEAPDGATIISNWLLRGAANDSTLITTNHTHDAWAFRLGTTEVSRTIAFSRGTLSFPTPPETYLSAFDASLGVVPEVHWPLIASTNSLVWFDSTGVGSLRVTWQNVLLHRASDKPISFQAELYPSGDFVYRYDFGSIQPTHYSIGAHHNGGGELYEAPIESSQLELHWTHFEGLSSTSSDTDGDGLSDADEMFTTQSSPTRVDSDADGLFDGMDPSPNNCDANKDGIPDGCSVEEWYSNPYRAESTESANLVLTVLQGMAPVQAPLRRMASTNESEEETASALVEINGTKIPARVGTVIPLSLPAGELLPWSVTIRGPLFVQLAVSAPEGLYLPGDRRVFQSGTFRSTQGTLAIPTLEIRPTNPSVSSCVHDSPGYRDYTFSVSPTTTDLSTSDVATVGFSYQGASVFRLTLPDGASATATGTCSLRAPSLFQEPIPKSVTIHRCQYSLATGQCAACESEPHNATEVFVGIENEVYAGEVGSADWVEVRLAIHSDEPVLWSIDSDGSDEPILFSSPTSNQGFLEIEGGRSVWVRPGEHPVRRTITLRHAYAQDVFDTATFWAGKVELQPHLPARLTTSRGDLMYEERLNPGGVVFVNLDNDDEDGTFDVEDLLVTGGDDELARLELRKFPSDLPLDTAFLIMDGGSNQMALWEKNTKASNRRLPNTGTFSPDRFAAGTANLWVEGTEKTTLQEGLLRLSCTLAGATFTDTATMTVLGIESVAWRGKQNSLTHSDALDEDPNWPLEGLQSYRVFPDSRIVEDALTGPRDHVDLVVTLSAPTPIPLSVHLRSFDVDDPTADSDEVDNEDINEDNRGAPKPGAFGNNLSTVELPFAANETQTNTEFRVTMHPGDNFRVVASSDADFLLTLSNNDTQIHGTNADKQRILCTDVAGTYADQEIRNPFNYASPTLTVWRFLHLEVDSMEAPPEDGPEANTVRGTVREILASQEEPWMIFFNRTMIDSLGDSDEQLRLEENRFENGWIQLGTNDTPVIVNDLTRNGTLSVTKDGMYIPFAMHSNQNEEISGNVISFYNSSFQLKCTSGMIGSDYVGGLLSIAGCSMNVTHCSVTNSIVFVSVEGSPSIPFVLHDDDDESLLPYIEGTYLLESSFKLAYILPIVDGGNSITNNQNNVPFVRNTLATQLRQEYPFQESKQYETNSFWIACLCFAFQPSISFDADPQTERVSGGETLCYSSNTSVDKGGSVSYIYVESCMDVEINGNPEASPGVISRTTVHELGHQLGLDHSSTSGSCMNPFVGIVNDSFLFSSLHIHLLRSREESPSL